MIRIRSFSLTVLTCVVALLCSPALAQHNLEEARKVWPDLKLFEPSDISGLNSRIKADLVRRGCRIPMFTKWDGQHNVVRGSFRKRDNRDVAVLCLAGDDMSVIIYVDGESTIAQEIRKFPANAYRMIHKVSPFVLGKRAIRDKATQRLPDFEHDGID